MKTQEALELILDRSRLDTNQVETEDPDTEAAVLKRVALRVGRQVQHGARVMVEGRSITESALADLAGVCLNLMTDNRAEG